MKATRLTLTLFLAGATALLLLAFVHRDYPRTGHDYAYFLARVVDTELHCHVNGLSVQWYTPSFGGGLPAYPNPQHLQFSLLQFLALRLDPWTATLASTLVFAVIGFLATHALLLHVARLHWTASLMGALLFTANGFYFEHMAAGHMGYQHFPLIPLLALALLTPRLSLPGAALLAALVMTMFVHQAGFYLAIITVLSLGICLPLLDLHGTLQLPVRQIAWRAMAGAALALLVCASKICAVYALMRFFPRQMFDDYPVGFLQGILGLATQLLGTPGLAPFYVLTGGTLADVRELMASQTGAHYGIWELDIGVSPIAFALIAAGLWLAAPRRRQDLPSLTPRQWTALAALAFFVWMTIEFSLAKGLVYPRLRGMVCLRSLHVNVRFAAAFVLPLATAAAMAFHYLGTEWSEQRRAASTALLGTVVILCLGFFFASPELDMQVRDFDPRDLQAASARAKHGEAFPVEEIAFRVPDGSTFLRHASSLPPYEALFGYRLEHFQPEVRPGPTDQVADGRFNMTDPRSLVYPASHHTKLYQRILVEDSENFLRFVNRRQPQWPLPLGQRFGNGLSAIGLGLAGVILLAEGVRVARRRRQRRTGLDSRG